MNDEPCVTYLGPGSAGHCVKMVHNGIEYGLMQLIAETYDLMKRGLRMSENEMQDVFARWSDSYLLEITARILKRVDERRRTPRRASAACKPTRGVPMAFERVSGALVPR